MLPLLALVVIALNQTAHLGEREGTKMVEARRDQGQLFYKFRLPSFQPSPLGTQAHD